MDWLFLAITIPFLIFLLAGVIYFYGREINIDVSHSLSNVRIFENDNVEVTLNIKNNGGIINYLEIFDTLPEKVKIEKNSNYFLTNLRSGEEVTIKYELCCPIRGHYKIGPIKFRVGDYLGLFYKEKTVDNVADLTVIPKIEEISDISVKGKVNPYPGIMQAKRAGIGTEFFGVRKYISGDTFKRINWKSYARWNNLMVNEYEMESTTDVIIILDARKVQGIGTITKNPLEYGVKAAVAVASHFLKRRDRVGLIAYGKTGGKLRWIYPESGKKQLYKIIREIVEIQPQGDFSLNGTINTALTHMLPKKSLIIFVSSLDDDYSIPSALERLVAMNYDVIVISPSPINIEYSLSSKDINHKLANRILLFSRNNFIMRLRNIGARVIDWDPDIPLAASLKEVERYQIRR
jgi:uncharacterized protein (DUF58 family)